MKAAIAQHAAGRPTIDSAPKDGSEIYSFDGEWWRRETRWQKPFGLKDDPREKEGWVAFRFLPIKPTHWCRPDEVTPEIMQMIYDGLK